jgi:hypothetical protein
MVGTIAFRCPSCMYALSALFHVFPCRLVTACSQKGGLFFQKTYLLYPPVPRIALRLKSLYKGAPVSSAITLSKDINFNLILIDINYYPAFVNRKGFLCVLCGSKPANNTSKSSALIVSIEFIISLNLNLHLSKRL